MGGGVAGGPLPRLSAGAAARAAGTGARAAASPDHDRRRSARVVAGGGAVAEPAAGWRLRAPAARGALLRRDAVRPRGHGHRARARGALYRRHSPRERHLRQRGPEPAGGGKTQSILTDPATRVVGVDDGATERPGASLARLRLPTLANLVRRPGSGRGGHQPVAEGSGGAVRGRPQADGGVVARHRAWADGHVDGVSTAARLGPARRRPGRAHRRDGGAVGARRGGRALCRRQRGDAGRPGGGGGLRRPRPHVSAPRSLGQGAARDAGGRSPATRRWPAPPSRRYRPTDTDAAVAVAVVARLRRARLRSPLVGRVGRAARAWTASSPDCSRFSTAGSAATGTTSC